MMSLANKKTATFNKRATPIFPSYRPMLRIGQVLLTLRINSVGNKASLLKLHLFSWAFKTQENLNRIRAYVNSGFQDEIQFFGIEPSLNRALNYAVAEKLIGYDGDKYYLKDKGIKIADKIIIDYELFINERAILISIGKAISESRIKQLQFKWKNA